MSVNVQNANNENIKNAECFITNELMVFYSSHRTYGDTFSVSMTEELDNFSKLFNNPPVKASKTDETKKYLKFKISDKLKVYDNNNKELTKYDLEELAMENLMKFIFTSRPYVYKNIVGTSFKVMQIKLSPKPSKYENCLFD